MIDSSIYLDSYIIQKDMRIRLPKEILRILNLSKGDSVMDIYVDKKLNQIVLKPEKQVKEPVNEK